MLAETPVEEFTAALDRCAADALWEAGFDRPPIDAFRLAERLGLHVAEDTNQAGRARFVRPQGGRPHETKAAILVAPDARPERRQWAVAHEVGEWLAVRVFETLGIKPTEAPALSREQIANSLAGRLLAPRRWLRNLYYDHDGDLAALKMVFQTASYELICRRLLESVDSPLVVTVYDQGKMTWRRWNRSGAAPPIRVIENDCQRFAHEVGQLANSAFAIEPPILRARCWPIHEPEWKRELTLTELDDFALEAAA